jgi:hypothetical protein
VSGQPHTSAALPMKNELVVCTEWKAGRVPDPVCTVLKRTKSLVAWIQTPDPSPCSNCTILAPPFCVSPQNFKLMFKILCNAVQRSFPIHYLSTILSFDASYII